MTSTEIFVPGKTEYNICNQPVFTELELQVIHFLSQDLTGAQIAKNVYRSPRTIETTRNSIKQKLGVKTLAGLIIEAIRLKIISI